MNVLYSTPPDSKSGHIKKSDHGGLEKSLEPQEGGLIPHTFIYIRHLSFAFVCKINVILQKSAVVKKSSYQNLSLSLSLSTIT